MENILNAFGAFKNFFANFNTAFTESDTMLFIVVWGLYIGIMIAIVLALISRTSSHRLVAALVRENASDPSSGKSFDALGIKKNFINKYIIRKNSPLRKYIKYNGEEMYLPEDKREAAQKRFSEEKSPVFTLIISAVVLFLIACFALTYIPQMISAYSNIGK